MKAVAYELQTNGEKSMLRDITIPAPSAKGHDLLVEVKAASINPVDYKIYEKITPEKGEKKILGWDASGIVKEVGESVTLFNPGDEVWYAGDLTRSGSFEEFQLVDERIVGAKPISLDFAQAAALPLTSLISWELIFDRMNIPQDITIPAKTIMIIGASGGVGSIMLQILRKLTGNVIIATSGNDKSKEWAYEMGADIVINHHNSLVKEIKNIGIKDIDYIISLTNTEQHYKEIAEIIAPQGSFGLIDDPKRLDITPLKSKSISIHWGFMFTRSMYQTNDMIIQNGILDRVSDLVDKGVIQSTVSEKMGKINAENITKAFIMLQKQLAHGKIVLEGF